jgi:hypothetical protein
MLLYCLQRYRPWCLKRWESSSPNGAKIIPVTGKQIPPLISVIDFSPITSELSDESEKLGKVMGFVLAQIIKKERETSELQKELLRELLSKKESEKLELQGKLEAEKLKIAGKKNVTISTLEKTISTLEKTVLTLEAAVAERTARYLRAKRVCDIRGALEFIRAQVRSHIC